MNLDLLMMVAAVFLYAGVGGALFMIVEGEDAPIVAMLWGPLLMIGVLMLPVYLGGKAGLWIGARVRKFLELGGPREW